MPVGNALPVATGPVVVECQNLQLRLGENEVLNGCDLALRRHQLAVVFGRSGSGKTTLLKALTGYLRPTSGSVQIIDASINAPTDKEEFRGDAVSDPLLGMWMANGGSRRPSSLLYSHPSPSAMMFADDTNLLPHLTAAQNLMIALAPIIGNPATRLSLVSAALALVGLSNVAGHTPVQMSSGQKRRLSLAQCLVRSPQFVALDEPTSALDTRTKFDILSLIQSLQERVGLTGLIVTHDIDTVLMVADEIIYFDDGKVQSVERVDHPKPRTPDDLAGSVFSDIRRRLINFLMSRNPS